MAGHGLPRSRFWPGLSVVDSRVVRLGRPHTARATGPTGPCWGGFFIFYFCFLQKYIFKLGIYRNIPRPPCCRAAGTWPPGCRAAGANLQKKEETKLQPDAWEPAARLGGGRNFFLQFSPLREIIFVIFCRNRP